MRNRTIAILALVLLTGLAATTLVSAETNLLQRTSGYAGGFCNCGAGWNGNAPGYCATYANQEPTVKTVAEALAITKTEISDDVTENDIYQMGRWWIVPYTGDDGTAKQGRIDAYTGEVIPDFFTSQYAPSQYRQGMGRGYGMMGMRRY